MSSSGEIEIDVAEICSQLRLSRPVEGWEFIKRTLTSQLGEGKDSFRDRIRFLDSVMYADRPYEHSKELAEQGVQSFRVLQGDIIVSGLAETPLPLEKYGNAERAEYVVLTRSCLVQEKRFEQAFLAKLYPVMEGDKLGAGIIAQTITRLNSFKFLYLPPIDNFQGESCFGNIVLMSEISLIANQSLQAATRVASLSEFGWHFLNFFLGATYTNSSEDDLKIRSCNNSKNVTLQ